MRNAVALTEIQCVEQPRCVEQPTDTAVLDRRAGLAVGGLVFVLLTVIIFWYQFRAIADAPTSIAWDRLRWPYLLLIVACVPAETLLAALRTSLVCGVLQRGVSLRTCIKAEWANVGLNLLTPCHVGGGPAQIYVMTRAGVRVGTALAISLMSFSGTVAGLFSIGLCTLLMSDAVRVRALASVTVPIVTVMVLVLAATAWRPEAFRIVLGSGRAMTVATAYRDEVRRFLRRGRRHLPWIYALSLGFLLIRGLIAYLCVRFLGIEAGSIWSIAQIQMAMAFVVLFAPTPGGAGVTESLSGALMADIVPIGLVPYYNLLWRFSTTYLVAIAGLVCLSRALLEHTRQVGAVAIRRERCDRTDV